MIRIKNLPAELIINMFTTGNFLPVNHVNKQIFLFGIISIFLLKKLLMNRIFEVKLSMNDFKKVAKNYSTVDFAFIQANGFNESFVITPNEDLTVLIEQNYKGKEITEWKYLTKKLQFRGRCSVMGNKDFY